MTNPSAVLLGAKPALQVIGPFTYREVNVKFNIGWNADATRVNYMLNTTYIPIDEQCKEPVLNPDEPPTCTLDDSMLLTVGNAPLMGFANQIMGAIHNATQIEADALGAVVEFVIDKINKQHSKTGRTGPQAVVLLIVAWKQ